MVELPAETEELAAEPDATFEDPTAEDPEVAETLEDSVFFRTDDEQEIQVGEDDAGNPLLTRATYFVGIVEQAPLNPMQRQELSTERAAEALQEEKDELQAKDELTDDEQDRLEELEHGEPDLDSANIDNTDVPDQVQAALVFASDADGSVGAPIASERVHFAGEQLVENGAEETDESDLPTLQDAIDSFEETVFGEEQEDEGENEQSAGIGGVEY